jgi:hypothetical protein
MRQVIAWIKAIESDYREFLPKYGVLEFTTSPKDPRSF